jgi:predicted flap endonuclease-1-like 5' DNA nuclease
MIELAMQILLCLFIAALLGGIIGYILGKISKCDKDTPLVSKTKTPLYDYDEEEYEKDMTIHKEEFATLPDATIKKDVTKGIKPIAYPLPKNGEADDLKKIQGIGIKVENALYEVGVFHYTQIADWTKDNTEWVDDYLSTEGRVKRESWISQAKELSLNTNI